MIEIKGEPAFHGIAIGPIIELEEEDAVSRYYVEDTEAEKKRFQKAQAVVLKELLGLYKKAAMEVGESNAAIFKGHKRIVEDEEYCDSIYDVIEAQRVNAEFAVALVENKFTELFAKMDEAYLKERAADIKDVSERLICVLSGEKARQKDRGKGIILAGDLSPSETIQLDKEKTLAFVTRKGSVNSHTAILARSRNIPALVLAPVKKGVDGKLAIVDGNKGCILIEPDEATLKEYEERLAREKEQKELLLSFKGKKAVTKSGKRIRLYANIGSLAETGAALENGAEGIGLFRSEFLYLESTDYPTEEEQFAVYKSLAEQMEGKKVIIRTLDVGADKKIGYFNLEKEENPALGCRAVRLCLERTEVFKTQLRALYRASLYGNVSIMIPMITSLWEVEEVKRIAKEAREELRERQVPFREAEFGIMIETPAAALISEELAREVDFFSIGTNDLTQYALAVDRQNGRVGRFFNARHPAVLKLIQIAIDSAHKAGIWVGICGELGADLDLTEQLVSMGIDELSVSPAMVLPICRKIREIE